MIFLLYFPLLGSRGFKFFFICPSTRFCQLFLALLIYFHRADEMNTRHDGEKHLLHSRD